MSRAGGRVLRVHARPSVRSRVAAAEDCKTKVANYTAAHAVYQKREAIVVGAGMTVRAALRFVPMPASGVGASHVACACRACPASACPILSRLILRPS
ncbi:hypothetical protein OAO87_01580 [bacterium]|nr:hypothetical protein [bacterium]